MDGTPTLGVASVEDEECHPEVAAKEEGKDVFLKRGPCFSNILSAPTEPISTNNGSFESL